MSDRVLKEPVHIALLRPTQLEKLAAAKKIDTVPYGLDPHKSDQPLPVAVKEKLYSVPKAAEYTRQAKKRIQLPILHANVPPIPKELTPPCGTCKTAACCRVFVVPIDKMEYDSGLYGDSAVKFEPEAFRQLSSKFLLPLMIGAPQAIRTTSYFLEGKIGEPCPFLAEDNSCSIYDIRPRTCRVYTCVGDDRISEGMRQDTESVDDTVAIMMHTKEVNDAK